MPKMYDVVVGYDNENGLISIYQDVGNGQIDEVRFAPEQAEIIIGWLQQAKQESDNDI